MVSNALDRSRNMPSTCSLFSKASAIFSINNFIYLFILSQTQKRPYMHTHAKKKKKKEISKDAQ